MKTKKTKFFLSLINSNQRKSTFHYQILEFQKYPKNLLHMRSKKRRKLYMKQQQQSLKTLSSHKEQVQSAKDLKVKNVFLEPSHFWILSKSFNLRNENLHDLILRKESEILLETHFKRIQRKWKRINTKLFWAILPLSLARQQKVLLYLLEAQIINKSSILFLEIWTFMALLELLLLKQVFKQEQEWDLIAS